MKKILYRMFILLVLLIIGKQLSFAQEEPVRVLVRESGELAYFYKIVNSSSKSIIKFKIGYNRYRKGSEEELSISPIAIGPPAGWEGQVIFLEESNYLHISWKIINAYNSIPPTATLDGFIVHMPQSDDLMKHADFTVLFEDGTWLSGKINEAITTDADGDGYASDVDCNDYDNTIYPNAPELCDNKDNDCDGVVDEGCCEIGDVTLASDWVAPKGTSGRPDVESTDISIWLKKPAPSGGCIIDLSVIPVPYSGGHNHHDALRPHGGVTSPVGFNEGEIGSKTAKYTSSKVAGTEEITLLSRETGDEKYLWIDVTVPILGRMPSSSYWRLTGQTTIHPENHYATATTMDAIAKIAFLYYIGTGKTLGLNDMSLVWGGLFDIYGNWNTPHITHRTGEDADIDRHVWDTVSQKYVLINCEDDDKLETMVNNDYNKARLLCESGGKKHIDIYY